VNEQLIDAARFFEAAILFEDNPWNILEKDAKVGSALPISCILTLLATRTQVH
jgi:NADP-dependent alcohol dehydrogenase